MDFNYIGENIKIYRKRKKLTQQELGERIGKTWEMISRYERGISSPLNQLQNIADTLEIDPISLMRDHSEVSVSNRIPLFLEIPESFTKQNTFLFYTCPDWIVEYDENSFVIDTKIIHSIHSSKFSKNGYLYISPNAEINEGDLILLSTNKKLLVEEFRKDLKKRIVGKVIAQEIRF